MGECGLVACWAQRLRISCRGKGTGGQHAGSCHSASSSQCQDAGRAPGRGWPVCVNRLHGGQFLRPGKQADGQVIAGGRNGGITEPLKVLALPPHD